MSASREKKTRQDPSGQGLSEKKLKQQQEERQTHVHHIVYTVLAVLVVLFGVGLLIWNSNFFQSRAAAVTIDGQDYTAADVQYYYNGALQQEIYNSYSGAAPWTTPSIPRNQIYDESTGETWRDHLLDVAIQTLTQQAAIAKRGPGQRIHHVRPGPGEPAEHPGLHSGRHHHLRLRQQRTPMSALTTAPP